MFHDFKNNLKVAALLFSLQVGCIETQNASPNYKINNTGLEVLETTYQAMHSAGQNIIGQNQVFAFSQSRNAPSEVYCNEKGLPTDDSEYVLTPSNDTDYAYKMIYCMATSDSGGPETALGSMQIAKGILCGLGPIEYSNKMNTMSYEFTSGSCFTQRIANDFIAVGANPLVVNYTASLSEEIGWDYKINMQFPQLNRQMSFKYKNSDQIVAAAMSDSEDGKTAAWIVSVNKSTGDLNYENMNHHLGSRDDNKFNRHARLYMNCEMYETNCEAVKKAEGLWSEVKKNNNSYISRIATLKGSSNEGYVALGFEGQASTLEGLNHAENYSHGSEGFGLYNVDTLTCYNSSYGTCYDLQPINFVSGEMHFLLLSDVTAEYPISWFNQQIKAPVYVSLTTELAQ